MHLIDDIDLMLSNHRCQSCPFNQVTDIIHVSLIGSIDFNDIRMGAIGCSNAAFTMTAGCFFWIFTIDCLGKQTGHRCLARASWSTEQIGMSYLVFFDGILDGAHRDFLPDNLVKCR